MSKLRRLVISLWTYRKRAACRRQLLALIEEDRVSVTPTTYVYSAKAGLWVREAKEENRHE